MKFFIKVDTDYCGTDNYFVVEAEDEVKASFIANELAYENAISFFNVVADEEIILAEENEEDTSDMITDEQYNYSIEEYVPEEHDYMDLHIINAGIV